MHVCVCVCVRVHIENNQIYGRKSWLILLYVCVWGGGINCLKSKI
jgi:hypothetical protein